MFDVTPFRRENDWLSRSSRSLFDHVFPEWNNDREQSFKPFHVDVRELDSCYVVEADLPGMRREDIEVQFENSYLTIWAHRTGNKAEEEQKGNFLHQERFYGQMSRSFYFDHINRDGIAAGFTDGVLKVTLPKDLNRSNGGKSIPIH